MGQQRVSTTAEEPRTWTEVSTGHKKFVDTTTAMDPEETDTKTLKGWAESAPVQMNLPPQGPTEMYAESVAWNPTPWVPPLKKSDIAKSDVWERNKKREQKKLTAEETLRQIKEEECLEDLACRWERCWQEEKECKWAMIKWMEQEGAEFQCQYNKT